MDTFIVPKAVAGLLRWLLVADACSIFLAFAGWWHWATRNIKLAIQLKVGDVQIAIAHIDMQ